jgi:cell division protein FtsB
METMALVAIFVLLILMLIVGGMLWARLDLITSNQENSGRVLDEKLYLWSEAIKKPILEQSAKLDLLKAESNILEQNIKLKMEQREHRELIDLILDTVSDDTEFIRSSFFQKLGSLTEYSEINSQIIAFQNRINSIIDTVREVKRLNDTKE